MRPPLHPVRLDKPPPPRVWRHSIIDEAFREESSASAIESDDGSSFAQGAADGQSLKKKGLLCAFGQFPSKGKSAK